MSKTRILLTLLIVTLVAGGTLGGYLVGQAQVKMPNTIIHHVVFKWKADTTDADKKMVTDNLKQILNNTKGVRNVWMKSVKVQPQDWSQTFVIEFENQAALDAYANHPQKQAWNDLYYRVREISQNCVTTN